MSVTWILSGNDVTNNQTLLSEIDLHGDRAYIIKPFGDLPKLDGPVISLVPLDMCLRVLRNPLYPGAYCNLANLKCTSYYQHFQKYLLNSDCIFLPIGMVRERKDDLFNWLGRDGAIFIRPDSGFKNFTGHVITEKNFYTDVDSIRLASKDDSLLCLIASPYNILKEWRFVIGNRKIIASSQYRNFKESPSGIPIPERELVPGSPIEVQKFVQNVLNDVDWSPDLLYTIDIGQLNNGFKIIEINCFSAAGLYRCDFSQIVSKVREIVIQDYDKNYNN